MALIALSVVEQRLDAVRAVLAGASVTEVAAQVGVSRQSVHAWVGRYLTSGVGGLADRSSRPISCPHQTASEVEVWVTEMRREHPRWGAKRIRLELLKNTETVPSTSTINRILRRQGVVKGRPRKRNRDSFIRFERPSPMQLWGIDIVGGITLVNPGTGELREAKIVTGVDDHSRFCVMAKVVERASGRAVCLAFAEALARHGVPEEVITDNGRQFTDRFSAYGPNRGEVLFDKICRRNGIAHRLTAPASPNQNGKVERFHGTFRPEIEELGPFESLGAAQGAVDTWVAHYNSERPHQGLDEKHPVMPADRFEPADPGGLELWLPPALEVATTTTAPMPVLVDPTTVSADAVEIERVVLASGNLTVHGCQFWIGPSRVGQTVRFWIDCEWIHLTIGEQRLKSLRSHFTVNDLAVLRATGARPAGPAPIATRGGPGAREGRTIVEAERTIGKNGTIRVGGHCILVAEILAGRRVGIYIEDGAPLLFFDIETRELLRTRANPFAPSEALGLQQTRPPGEVPRPSTEPITVQRRASATGVIIVAGQRVPLGRSSYGATVTVHVSETTLAVVMPDGDTRTFRRTTEQPVRSMKGQRSRIAKT